MKEERRYLVQRIFIKNANALKLSNKKDELCITIDYEKLS